jgi:ElaB/YqjD/DUF883 family membrane-anchored ribosome-binding protein
MASTYTDATIGRTGEAMGDKAHAGIDRLSSTAHDAVERAANLASSTADRFGSKSRDVLAMGDQWMNVTRECVRDHPFATIGVALAAGYLLSRITSR